jgi:hypothetical protein
MDSGKYICSFPIDMPDEMAKYLFWAIRSAYEKGIEVGQKNKQNELLQVLGIEKDNEGNLSGEYDFD